MSLFSFKYDGKCYTLPSSYQSEDISDTYKGIYRARIKFAVLESKIIVKPSPKRGHPKRCENLLCFDRADQNILWEIEKVNWWPNVIGKLPDDVEGNETVTSFSFFIQDQMSNKGWAEQSHLHAPLDDSDWVEKHPDYNNTNTYAKFDTFIRVRHDEKTKELVTEPILACQSYLLDLSDIPEHTVYGIVDSYEFCYELNIDTGKLTPAAIAVGNRR